MIRITDIKEVRQLEDGSWKFAAYTPDEHIAELLTVKKQARETGRELTVQADAGSVEPTLDSLDSIVDQIMLLASKLKGYAAVTMAADLLTEAEQEEGNELNCK